MELIGFLTLEDSAVSIVQMLVVVQRRPMEDAVCGPYQVV
jgi:hypothetical protein